MRNVDLLKQRNLLNAHLFCLIMTTDYWVVRQFLIRQFQRHILSRLFLKRQFLIRQFLSPSRSHKTVSQRTISHQVFSHTKHSWNIRRLYYPTFSHLNGLNRGPIRLRQRIRHFPSLDDQKRHFLIVIDKNRHFPILNDKKRLILTLVDKNRHFPSLDDKKTTFSHFCRQKATLGF